MMFAHLLGRTFSIRIDFPALDNYVAYLRESEQQQVDATTAQLRQITQALKQSGVRLNQSVANQQGQ